MLKAILAATITFAAFLSVFAPFAGAFPSAQVKAPAGTPSTQPDPANPQPRPTDPQPDPKDPQGEPERDTPKPNDPPASAPGSERDNRRPFDPNDRVRGQREANQAATSNRYARPFAFQSPEYEARFSESTERLICMEARMKTRQAELVKRLGDVRAMPPERQNTALFDLLQQVLQDQAELNDYLVQSRTAWSGEMELAEPRGVPPEQAPPISESGATRPNR